MVAVGKEVYLYLRYYGRHLVVIVRWLLYAGKFIDISGNMVDRWLLL